MDRAVIFISLIRLPLYVVLEHHKHNNCVNRAQRIYSARTPEVKVK